MKKLTRWQDTAIKIQSAALSPDLWPQALETTGNLLGASSAGLFLHDAQSGACLAAVDWNLDHSSVQDYLNYFCSVDPLLDAGMRLSEGEIACGQELVPREEYLKSEHYNDFWQPQNLSDALTVFPIRNDHHSAHFTFFYPDEFEDSIGQHRRMLSELLPYVQTSLAVQLKMQAFGWRAASLEGAFERLGLGVMLLSERGRIQEMNRKAREILACRDGLISVGRTLSAVNRSTRRGLSRAIQRITESGAAPSSGQELFIERASGKAPYRLTLLPLLPDAAEKYPWVALSRAATIALIEDPEVRNSVSPEFLHRRYGLTGAEARLAASFAETASLKVSADALGITEGTARQYLKRIFHKTDTKSQAELMKLMLCHMVGR